MQSIGFLAVRDCHLLTRSFEIGEDEEEAEEGIGGREDEVGMMHAALRYQRKYGDGVGGFFQDRGNHQGTKTNGIRGDEAEGDLPGEGASDESIKKAGMRNCRRILAADEIKHEIEGSNDEQAPHAGNPKHDFCEFHVPLLIAASRKINDSRGMATLPGQA